MEKLKIHEKNLIIVNLIVFNWLIKNNKIDKKWELVNILGKNET